MYSCSITNNNNKLNRLTKKGVWYRLLIKRKITILKYYYIEIVLLNYIVINTTEKNCFYNLSELTILYHEL